MTTPQPHMFLAVVITMIARIYYMFDDVRYHAVLKDIIKRGWYR